MPANVYECMFLLDTNKVAGDVPTAAKQLHAVLERNHAEILASRPWDERRLAYSINKHKKGPYYLTYFRTEGKNVTGIRRDQAPTRANARVIEWDGIFNLVKINPLAACSWEDVERYVRSRGVPKNPLHDRGYPSIGCAPCTSPVAAGEDPRSGRWRGIAKIECGLHAANGGT